MFKETTLARALRLAAGAVAAASLSAPALAQQAGADGSSQRLERIEVTGSSIKRTSTETASPVQIINREEIERTGKQNLAEVVRGLSSDNNGTIPSGFTAGFAAGASGVSLRGLGVNATLVLVNGRRMATYGLADDGQRSFVDLNSIPLEIVDRIEVLKDGASAIYGSDAIAGVINIILRKEFKGAALGATFGTSYKSDGNLTRLSGTAGFGDLAADKYNAFVTLEAAKSGRIRQDTRDSYLGTNKLDTVPETLGYYDQRLGGINPTTQLPFRQTPFGTIRPFNPATGAGLGPFQPVGGPGVCAQGFNAATGACYFDQIVYSEIQPQVDRVNLFGRASFELGSNLLAFAEAGIFRTKTKTVSTPQGVASVWGDLSANSVISSAGITLPVGHPDNPFSSPAQLRYITADVGQRRAEYDNQNLRFVGGLKGTAASWDYEAGAGYLESKLDETRRGFLRYSVLLEGLASGVYRINNPAAVPADFYARLSPDLSKTAKNTVTFADFKASRELMPLDGGALGVALGAEVRREESDSPPTPFTFEADIVGLGFSAFSARRTVTAVYGELNAPVHKMLELNAAARVDHYSDYGSSTTPKLGFKFTPTPVISLRGTYAEAFRAPGPAENGNSSTAGFAGILLVTKGNPDIKPEKAKSYTLGLVLDAQQGTTATIDFYSIDKRDEIVGADTTLVVGNLPTDGQAPNSTRPGALPNSLLAYDENGVLTAAFAPYINATTTKTSGVDLNLRHRFNLGEYGKLTANLDFTRILKFRRTLADGTVFEFAGTHGPFVLSSAGGTPKNRAAFELAWERAAYGLAARVNYVGGMLAVNHTLAPYDPGSGEGHTPPANASGTCGVWFPDGRNAPGDNCKIASFTTLDLSGKWRAMKNLELTAAIQNVTNKRAPWDPYTYGAVNYNVTLHQAGAVGRFFQVGARYSWE
jgi:iron complex outermembrane receptor protein